MADVATTEELFFLAIQVERAAEQVYNVLNEKFAHHPEVAVFWKVYAGEEASHARWLERLREKCPTRELAKPADLGLLNASRNLLQSLAEYRVAYIRDLEEAYQVGLRLESLDANALYTYLLSRYAPDRASQTHAQGQLKAHMSRFCEDFPPDYGSPEQRRAVRALPNLQAV